MRMWMVEPIILCNDHLLQEHTDCHDFVWKLNNGEDITAYLATNVLEVGSLQERHDFLANEMVSRRYIHMTPWPRYTVSAREIIKKFGDKKIDAYASLKELLGQCGECRMRYDQLVRDEQIGRIL